MRHVLVPLDGSGFAESALPLAGAIAARTGSALELVTVNPPIGHPDISAAMTAEIEVACGVHARSYLEDRADAARRDFAVPVNTAVLEGAVPGALAEHVRRRHPELVVMSTHGRSGPSRLVLGSVADRLLRELHCPLLLVRPTSPAAAGQLAAGARVLVPLDGSALAESVLDSVGRLFQPALTTLYLLRVVPPAEVFPVGEPVPLPPMEPNLMAARLSAAKTYLEATASRLQQAGWRVEQEMVTGWNPAAEVLRSAEASRCELIAMATRGLGGVRRMFLGSVADRVIRGASTPVLVLNPGAGELSQVPGEQADAAVPAGGTEVGVPR